ncbi:sensor histidine kinase [Rhodopirellula sp. JC639]|uniref:sensor histidine kinase n=1 Tax=Stieleria mannarensis TaxID=2755585 RepID=UPI0016025210|nr:ATP-binding protein [Rhodopirellula sp. JC639]
MSNASRDGVDARFGGVAIAPAGAAEAGPEGATVPAAATASSITRAGFRPRSGMIVVGMIVIVAVVWLTTLLDAGPTETIVATVAICFLVGTALVINNLLRWEHAENAYEKQRLAAETWNARFRKLHSDSTRTNAVLSHMTDGIVMLSPKTEILLINEAAIRLLAIPGDGVYLGRRLAELVRVPEIVHAARRTQSDKVDQNVSVEIVDGSIVRPVAVRISRIHDADPPHLLLVLRDETEAQRVEAIRREFIANVSHELKTPLAAIKGYAETVGLAIEDDPESAKHFIAQIDTQCLRLEELIADMMRLARAQSGKSTLMVQNIDLEKVIQQALDSFTPVAAAKQIELTVRPSDGPVHVLADEEAALAITQNLISNAIRHTDAGGHVTVSCRRANDGWTMAVQDDGVGIAAEFQERIFERFYRVKRGRKAPDGGTGIGLAIVKNLTRALGGTVSVTSSPGEGATFEVWLPKSK